VRELPADIARQLLIDARLKPAEVDDRETRARDASYWRQLAPEVNVDGAQSALPYTAMASETIEAAAASLQEDGVLHLKSVIDPQTIARLNTAIDRVVGAGWPAVFAGVFDEFWLCTRASALRQAVGAALGDETVLSPKIWIHVVRPSRTAAGWPPHLDGPGRRRVNCWLALTDATAENGCMHVIPRPLALPALGDRLDAGEAFTTPEILAMLHGATPLPASAGDFLAWSFDILHWGGQARRGRSERRSLAFELIAKTETLEDDERAGPPIDGPLPPLEMRLQAIAGGILRYRKFEPRLMRFEELATRLLIV
jgi:hypothetical protein